MKSCFPETVPGLNPTALARLTETVIAACASLPVTLLREARPGHRALQRARRRAVYLAHVGFGLSLTATGLCFGLDRTTVRHACAIEEDGRDDPRADLTLDALEAGLSALAASLAEGAGR